MYYYINGKYINSKEAKIPFSDAGFLYGDGLFETMRFDKGKIFSINSHLNRLLNGLKIINLHIALNKKEISNLLIDIIKNNNLKSGIIRLMITRGITNNIDLGKINNPSIYISIKPFYKIPQPPVRVIYLDEKKFPIIRFSPAIKSMNYLGNMLAKNESKNNNAFEPIFYNKDKIITECAIRNIFYIKNNRLLTPSLDLGILPGVMRDTIIDIAKKLNINVQESHIHYDNVDMMDEAFISSTGIGLLECYWNGWKSDFIITKQIKKELFKRIKNS